MRIASALWTSFCKGVLDAVYPSRCALCSILGDAPVCPACASDFDPSRPFVVFGDGDLAYRAAIYRYEGRAAQAVRRLKYDRATSLAAPLAAWVREAYDQLDVHPEAVVPVPIHPARRRRRGFNQAELLCEALPRDLVRPALLRRIRRTRPQVGLNYNQRSKNLTGAFAAAGVAGKRILLVDDVLTSGQTARECAKTLLAAGAVEVGILAFAGEA